MNGNGTAPETPVEVPETPEGVTAEPWMQPAPPPWMHDFLPASCIFDCQGPDCDQAARAYWQNNVGFVAPGWQALDQKPMCSWLCVARYAALRAEDQLAVLRPNLDEAQGEALPLGTRKRARHN